MFKQKDSKGHMEEISWPTCFHKTFDRSLRGGGGEVSSFATDTAELYDELFGAEFDAEKIPSPRDRWRNGPLSQARQARYDAWDRKRTEAKKLGSRRGKWVHDYIDVRYANLADGDKWLKGYGWQRSNRSNRDKGYSFYHDPRSSWYTARNRGEARVSIQRKTQRTWLKTGPRVMRRDKWSAGQRRREVPDKPRANVMVGSLRGGALEKEDPYAALCRYEQKLRSKIAVAVPAQKRELLQSPPFTPHLNWPHRTARSATGTSPLHLLMFPSPPASRAGSTASIVTFDPYVVWPNDAPFPPSYDKYHSPEYDHTGFFRRPVSADELSKRLDFLPETGRFRRCEDGSIERVGEWMGKMEEKAMAAALRGGELGAGSEDESYVPEDISDDEGNDASPSSPAVFSPEMEFESEEKENNALPLAFSVPGWVDGEEEIEELHADAVELGLSQDDFSRHLDDWDGGMGLADGLSTIYVYSSPPAPSDPFLSDINIDILAPPVYSPCNSFTSNDEEDKGLWVAVPRRVVELLIEDNRGRFSPRLLRRGRGLLRWREGLDNDDEEKGQGGRRFIKSAEAWRAQWEEERRVERKGRARGQEADGGNGGIGEKGGKEREKEWSLSQVIGMGRGQVNDTLLNKASDTLFDKKRKMDERRRRRANRSSSRSDAVGRGGEERSEGAVRVQSRRVGKRGTYTPMRKKNGSASAGETTERERERQRRKNRDRKMEVNGVFSGGL